MTSDGTLLLAYSQSGSEAAFAELVQRHLDFVYSTALRAVHGDAHLAKDVSQTVFLDLARKASTLAGRPVLAGWLYTSTCYAASKAARSERRRFAREQAAQSMQEPLSTSTRSWGWDEIAPVLNAAMMELKERDREVILLRFFEHFSLAEVGEKLGLPENTARMRVQRALERLRDRLSRFGITSTASALSLALAEQTLAAAPAGLAASITAASLAASGGTFAVSLSGFFLMTKTKMALLTLGLAAGLTTPIVIQHQNNKRLNTELDSLRTQLAERTTVPVISNNDEEWNQLRKEHAELIRLRGEISAMRQNFSNLSKSTSDSAKADLAGGLKKAGLSSEAERAKVLLAKSPEIPMMPASSWKNSGFTDPAAALQTMNWAAANQDTNAFLNGISWDSQARERADQLFASLPEAVREKYGTIDGVIIDWLLNHATSMASFRVLSQSDDGPDDRTLIEQHQYTDDRVRENSVQFHRDENGNWRQVLPPELMPKLEVVVNNLADGSPNGGK